MTETGGLTEAYRYLPAKAGNTLTGTAAHQNDILGMLRYQISAENPDLEGFKTGEEIVKQDTKPVYVTLTVDFDPLDDPSHDETSGAQEAAPGLPADRKEANDALVQENAYAWDILYNSSAGSEWTRKVVIEVGDRVEVISGEVQLQLSLTAAQAAALNGSTVTYAADLVRKYEGRTAKVGTLRISGTVAAGTLLYTSSFEPLEAYMDYLTGYALPLGAYTLENGQGTSSMPGVTFHLRRGGRPCG